MRFLIFALIIINIPFALAGRVQSGNTELLAEILNDKEFLNQAEKALASEIGSETVSLKKIKWMSTQGGEFFGKMEYFFVLIYNNFTFTALMPLKVCVIEVTLNKFFDGRPAEKISRVNCSPAPGYLD